MSRMESSSILLEIGNLVMKECQQVDAQTVRLARGIAGLEERISHELARDTDQHTLAV